MSDTVKLERAATETAKYLGLQPDVTAKAGAL